MTEANRVGLHNIVSDPVFSNVDWLQLHVVFAGASSSDVHAEQMLQGSRVVMFGMQEWEIVNVYVFLSEWREL